MADAASAERHIRTRPLLVDILLRADRSWLSYTGSNPVQHVECWTPKWQGTSRQLDDETTPSPTNLLSFLDGVCSSAKQAGLESQWASRLRGFNSLPIRQHGSCVAFRGKPRGPIGAPPVVTRFDSARIPNMEGVCSSAKHAGLEHQWSRKGPKSSTLLPSATWLSGAPATPNKRHGATTASPSR